MTAMAATTTTNLASSLVPPMMQLEPKQQTAMRTLISRVARAFYDTNQIILLELLSKHNILRDDDLAGRVGLPVKELNKLMSVLTNHKLIQQHRQNEMKEGQNRIFGRVYFWVDLQQFCNVVKWRLSDMHKKINDAIQNETQSRGWICPECQREYDTIQADRLLDMVRQCFVCEVCDTELEDNTNSAKVQGSKDRMRRFNAQMKWIRDAIRATEGIVLPGFNVAQYVRDQMAAAARALASEDSDGLKIATGAGALQEVEVQMAEDEDDEARRKAKERQAAAKRVQNALPSWHTQSTISGEKTALGIKEAQMSSNQALLDQLDREEKNRGAKRVKERDAADVDRYYDALMNDEDPTVALNNLKRKREEEAEQQRAAKLPRMEGPPGYPPYYLSGMPPPPVPGFGYPPYPGYPPHPHSHPHGFPYPAHPYPFRPPTAANGTPAKPNGVSGTNTPTNKANGVTRAPSSLPTPVPTTAPTSPKKPSKSSESGSTGSGSGGYPKSALSKGGERKGNPRRVSFANKVEGRSPPAHHILSDDDEVEEVEPTISRGEFTKGGEKARGTVVKVNGIDKPILSVTEADHDLMTPEEYQVYYDLVEQLGIEV